VSTDQLLSRPDRTDLGVVADWLDASVSRVKTALVKRCGGEVEVRVLAPDVRPLVEVLEPGDQPPGATAPFTLTPGNLRGLVVLDVMLVQRLVGLLLGEDLDRARAAAPRRLTRLDLQLAKRVCQDTVAGLLASSPMPDVPEAQVGAVASNPRSVQGLPQSPSVIVASLEVGPEGAPFGQITVVLPAQAAGVLWPERSSRPKPRQAGADGLGRVLPIQVPVVAELARRKVPMSRLQALAVGEVLDLGRVGDVELRVGDRPALFGEPGEAEGLRSVRIRRRAAAG
jgi:flagellar motor switch protein FliM